MSSMSTSTTRSPDQCVKGYISGDEEAFTDLVQSYSNEVSALLEESGCHPNDIEDSMQSVWEEVERVISAPQYNDEFSSTLKDAVGTVLMREAEEPLTEPQWEEFRLSKIQDRSPMVDPESVAAVREALCETLSPGFERVVVPFVNNGGSFYELAKIFNIDENHLRNLFEGAQGQAEDALNLDHADYIFVEDNIPNRGKK